MSKYYKYLDVAPQKTQTVEIPKSEALAKIEKAAILIKEAKTLDETFVLKALFREAEIKARRQGLTEVEQKAIEYKYWVQDKIGEILERMKESGQRATSGGQFKDSQKNDSLKTLKDLGLTSQESYLAQKFHNLPEEKKAEVIEKAKKKVEVAKRQVQEEMDKEILRANPEPIEIPKQVSIQIIEGQFQHSDQKEDSANAVITDPPYGKEFSDWIGLGSFANRVLKPGGFLIAYSGHSRLDEKMKSLSAVLTYYWIIAVKHKEVGIVPPFGIQSAWKPIVVYAKDPVPKVGFYDFIEGKGQDKEFHEWGQPEEEAKKLIETFTAPGDTVFEPFAGGGSVIEACIQTKRNCVAFEKDPETYKLLKRRFPDST